MKKYVRGAIFFFGLSLFGGVHAQAATNPAGFDGWRHLPARSQDEYRLGSIGGEGLQHPHGIARSRSNPSIVYLSHDCSGVWISTNSGSTWRHTLGIGLGGWAGGSIEVDPVDPNLVLVARFSSYDVYNQNSFGIYRSTDGGENFNQVFSKPAQTTTARNPNRNYQHNIAYALSSVKNGQAQKWYAAIYDFNVDSNKIFIYYSSDAGITWSQKSVLTSAGSVAFDLEVHPRDPNILLLAASNGLYRSTDAGTSFTKITSGISTSRTSLCSSVEIDQQNPNTVYIVANKDLYKSTDTGATFSIFHSYGYGVHVFSNPGYPNRLYMVGDDTSKQSVHAYSGSTWITNPTVKNNAFGTENGWGRNLFGQINNNSGGVAPNPKNADEAIIYAASYIFKTTDGGSTISVSSTMYGGLNCSINNSIVFDPSDSNRMMFFIADKGAVSTTNSADWFASKNSPLSTWRSDKKIPWTSGFTGDWKAGSDVVVGAFGDVWKHGISYSTNAGTLWNIGADSNTFVFYIKYHKQNPNIVYAANRKSTDGGITWSSINWGSYGSLNPTIFGVCNDNSNIVYAYDRSTIKQIYKSTDAGATWSLYAQTLHSHAPYSPRPTLTLDPAGSCNKVYGLDSTRDLAVFNGSSWKSLNVLDLVDLKDKWAYVSSVQVDPRYPNIIYATIGGVNGVSNIFRSTDSGSSWTDISYNLPRRTLAGIAGVSPHTGEVFVSNCFGVKVLPPPYESSTPIYDRASSVPSCYDGLQNGDETDVDSGGACGGDQLLSAPRNLRVLQ